MQKGNTENIPHIFAFLLFNIKRKFYELRKKQTVEYKSVICFKGLLVTQVDEKCGFSAFSIISSSEAQLRNVLTISFYFLYSDALTFGALLTLEGPSHPGLANS